MMGTQETIKGILGRLEQLDRRLTRVERTLEKLTLDIEEEARSFVAHQLRQMGIEIAIGSLVLPDLELNILVSMEDVTSRVKGIVTGEMTDKEALEARKAEIAKIEKESLESTGFRSDVEGAPRERPHGEPLARAAPGRRQDDERREERQEAEGPGSPPAPAGHHRCQPCQKNQAASTSMTTDSTLSFSEISR